MKPTIHILLVSGEPRGFTDDKQWADEWVTQLEGRSTVEIGEIKRQNPQKDEIVPRCFTRISIDDPRLKWKTKPPLVTINGLEYCLLGRFVANSSFQAIQDGEKVITPIMDMDHAFHRDMLDYVFESMCSRGRGLNEQFFQMTIFSSVMDTGKLELAYIEEARHEANLVFSFKETMPKEFHFPFLTKHLPNPPRFNLVNGLWKEDENGEYEDIFCCMEMVPFACSIRFKSPLRA